MQERKQIWESAIFWLGLVGTILGIVSFLAADLPQIFGGGDDSGLSEADIVATLAALQADKERAELQLTGIALENAQAANQATEQAIQQQQADFQATLDAIRTEQEAAVATNNAIVALTATANAGNMTATAGAAAATETAAAAAAATEAAEAQITPTATPAPTDTPIPTLTPTPAIVADYRLILDAAIAALGQGQIVFSLTAGQPIPVDGAEGLAYVWSLDTDFNPETGLGVKEIGADARVTIGYAEEQWYGLVTPIAPDGTLGEPFIFVDIEIDGVVLTATLNHNNTGLPLNFDWVVRAETSGEAYSFFPESGSLRFGS